MEARTLPLDVWRMKESRICVCVLMCGREFSEKTERIDPENAPNALFFGKSGRWEGIYSEFVMFCLVHTSSFC